MFDRLSITKTFHCVSYIHVFVGVVVGVWGDEKVEMGRKLYYQQRLSAGLTKCDLGFLGFL